MSKKAWKKGESTDNKYLIIKVPLVEKVIEYTKKDSKGVEREVKINRLATLLGSNGFGSFILGQDDKGNNITISLKVNKVNPTMQSDINNSDFEMLED